MKKKPLILLIWTIFYSQYVLANSSSFKQCVLGMSIYNKVLVSNNINHLPINIRANKIKAYYPYNMQFIDNVIMQQGNSILTANKVKLHQTQKNYLTIPVRTLTAIGNVTYEDPYFKLQGQKGWLSLNNKDINIDKGQYQMVGQQGRGDADVIKLRSQNRYAILKNGTFTSCLFTDNSWSIKGSKIIHDRKEQITKIWNARFKIGGIPVFYSPYLQLPIGNKRHSGFLMPDIIYTSNNYFEFNQSYYWNITPNLNATITTRYLRKQGIQWQNQFRYLLASGNGSMALEWLPNDKAYMGNNIYDKNKTRWLYNWQHNSVLDNLWHFSINYTKISDTKYFNDLISPYGSTANSYATQIFSTNYSQKNWNATLSSKQFQVFTNKNNGDTYRAQPQIDINYYKNKIGPFNLHTYGQAVRFISVNPNNPKTNRFHVESAIYLPLTNAWSSFNIETKLMATHYQQDIPINFSNTYKYYINRIIPQFKINSQIMLKRAIDWNSHFIQTLEPRAQYFYSPYHYQDNIYIYDTTLLQTDYNGLFRDRSYSGLDRIAPANQVAMGLISRIFDDSLVERFNVSLGQIYNFSHANSRSSTMIDNNNNIGNLIWIGDSNWKITNTWKTRGEIQYDAQLGSLIQGNGVIEYRNNDERIFQLNYRYASPEYIKILLPKRKDNHFYKKGISQIGIVTSLPLTNHWTIVGAYNYDIKVRKPTSKLVGLQYTTCCWAVKLDYERKIMGWNIKYNNSKYNNHISFNLRLRGLNNNFSLNTHNILNTKTLPYQSIF
ncbi:LPS assembly protein LptD [Candidatus Fukatsuia anoeciicola]|uniref:LPS assembly protein LptD n=1 Tax=Candidatus Fukatsuia anoeciicola TaxID=2994492 RepID=UPI00346425E6